MFRSFLKSRWFQKFVASARQRKQRKQRKYRNLFLEELEPRILLDGGLAPALVVGRTLSSYFIGGVQNNQETITYTVYNEQATAETGVLLTDTLQPGVTFQSASQLPDQSGQKLAWSLGTIQGFDRASVTLTVSLPNVIPAQLDVGAQAYATLDAGAVSNSTPAVVLQPGNVSDPSLLASTPDANTTDPYIQEEAAALGYNAQNIYNFLQTQIGYNSYLGSVRGARGTLWSDAGDALDVASLGVALMRASGIPAQYVSGTLSQGDAQQLILSMFPASDQTVGYIPAGTQTSDPTNDPQLLAETESHYWFQFDTGSGFQDADPLFAGATIGQTFTTATGTFTEVPDALREKTEVSLAAEIYDQGAAALGIGDGLSQTVVLDQTFNDVDLVGRPLSFGNFVSGNAAGIIFSATTYTYTPFVTLGDDAYPNPSGDQIITGTPYQEMFSNFPLVSSKITGLFLTVTLSGPQGAAQTYNKTLVDNIGEDIRQNGGTPTGSGNPAGSPSISPTEVWSMSVQASDQDARPATTIEEQVGQDFTTVAEQNTAGQTDAAVQTLSYALIGQTRAYLTALLRDSASLTDLLAAQSLIAAYASRPRITLMSANLTEQGPQQSHTSVLSFEADLLADSVSVVVAPNQSDAVASGFRTLRGILENAAETNVFPPPAQASGVSVQPAISAITVAQAAADQNIPMVTITPDDPGVLETLAISSVAKARITTALQAGFDILVPAQEVTVNGTATIAWMQTDPVTGETTGVSEDGSHGASFEAFAAIGAGIFAIATVQSFAGTDQANIIFAMCKLSADQQLVERSIGPGPSSHYGGTAHFVLFSEITEAVNYVTKNAGGFNAIYVIAFTYEIYHLFDEYYDPPVAPILVAAPLPPLAFTNLVSQEESVTASAGPVAGAATAAGLAVSGAVSASWQGAASSAFLSNSLTAGAATVSGARGAVIGSGAVGTSLLAAIPITVSGAVAYNVQGTGNLSFYSSTAAGLAVDADWNSYAATLSGGVTLTLTTDALTLNNQTLPAGTYTITTNSATLSGNGPSTSPNFSGSASITATGGTVNLGPGSGSVTVGGTSLDLHNGGTLDGYTGSITVAPGGGNADDVTLNGSAANVLTVSATPGTLTTNQNTPVTFQVNVNTSFADSYNLTATAPPGWTVTIDNTGKVIATPASGLQSGNYPIQIIAQSTTNPDLVAQATVEVTITPTMPGINFSVTPDTMLTLPFDGAQLPSAFDASLQNLGPAADSYNLTFANIPAGFTLLNSGTSVTVPAGQTGILGLYLTPNIGQPIPPPGTVLSFTVTATSTTDPSITQSQVVTFTVPDIDALTLTDSQPGVSTTPGASANDTITVTNVGNVAEDDIVVTAANSSGLTVGNLTSPLSLDVGQSTTLPASFAVDASIPLNSFLSSTITATYGPTASPLTQTLTVPVDVVLPGTVGIANASFAAQQLGNTALATQLQNLGTDLDNLIQNTTSAIYKSQVLADLDAVNRLLGNDQFLTTFPPAVTSDRGEFATAVTPADYQKAATDLGNDLTGLAQTLSDEAAFGFTFSLNPHNAVALPGAAADFGLSLQNTGTQAETYQLALGGVNGVTYQFLQNGNPITQVTLQPGQALNGGDAVTLELTETGNSLFASNFNVSVFATDDSHIALTIPGALTVRSTFVDVTQVTPSPAFTNSGSLVDVTAQILNEVNAPQSALVSYTVTDPSDDVVFTSAAVPLALTVNTSLETVDLHSFPTTGLADGDYTINVTVTDSSGNPIPGGSGQGTVLVGTPLSATLTVSPTTVPEGGNTVANTLTLTGQAPLPDPLTLDGQASTTPTSTTVALDAADNLAYVAGTNGIDIVDISNPASPTVLSTFAQAQIVQGGYTVVREDVIGGANYLVVGTTATLNADQFNLLIFSLTDPRSPTLVSNTTFDYEFMSELLAEGNTLLVTTNGVIINPNLLGAGPQDQYGTVLSIDVSYPAMPTLTESLYNDKGTPYGGDTQQNGGVLVNSQIAYVASSTSTGDNTEDGVGRVLVVNDSDPANLQVLGEVDIPDTVQVVDVAIQGTTALVVGSTGGTELNSSEQPYLSGNLTLSVLDLSDPTNPTLVGTTLVTDAVFQQQGLVGKISALPLGSGLFAVSDGIVNGKPVLLLVDPTDPNNLVVTADQVPALVNEMAVSGGLLYTTSTAGLLIYNIGTLTSIPYTASVEIPNNTGVAVVPGSFNFAPTQIITGADFDTLVFKRSLAFGEAAPTFTWQSTISNVPPGQVVDATLGGTVSFTSQGTSGTATLPPTTVTGVQVLSLSPATQTAAPGAAVRYTLTVTNATSSDQQFQLSVLGLPASWVQLSSSDVMVAADSSSQVTLMVTPPGNTPVGDYGFTIMSSDDTSNQSTVQADLVVAGAAPAVDPNSHGVVVTLTPVSATAGQETSAVYTVQLTNTGSVDDTFALSDAGLPAGVLAAFSQAKVDVPPGVSNFRDVTLTLTPAPGTTAAHDSFTVTATSTSDASILGSTNGTLNVVNNGVSVSLNANSGAPGTTFEATITNTGSVTDTFDLSLASPAGLVASLGVSKVTLAAGASQMVTVSTGAVDFAVPGSLALTVLADSEGDPAVEASASADLTIADSTGLTASFSPAVQNLAAPGMASFILNVNNTGNTEDAYTATITGSNGPVTATLMGLDGQPTQTIPVFRLPGLSSGAILLQVSLASIGTGAVSVQVKSMDDRPLTSDNTATVTSGPVVLTDTTGGQGLTLERTAGLGVGSVTYILGDNAPVALTNVTSFTYDGQGAGDTMTVLFANGEPLTTGGVFFNGPTGGAALTIDAAGLPVRTVAGAVTAGDPQTVAYTNVAATNLNNAAGVDAFAGPDTADRAAAFTGLTAQERFVQALYLDELGRAGAKSELDGWVTVMNGPGNTQASVAAAIQKSLEAEDRLVKSWYVAYLGRQAVGGEELGWVSMLQQGRTEEQVLSGILAGPEFYTRAQTLIGSGTADERYVQALYEVLLDRTGESSGVASWLSGLPTLGRQGVALDFLTESEFRTYQFEGYYNALLHRPDDPTGLNGWVFSNLDVASVRINFEAGAEFFTNG